jgi:hypothetical protein
MTRSGDQRPTGKNKKQKTKTGRSVCPLTGKDGFGLFSPF